jgi:hypothetical protein
MATGIFKLRDQLYGLVQKAWTGTQKTNFVEYLVVAGGASGGYADGGGGGAGGLLQGIVPITTDSPITVSVGGGGTVSASYGAAGNNGSNSVFGSVTAIGGGGGAGYTNPSKSGGSGGGGSASYNPDNRVSGQRLAGQGNVGGYGQQSPINACGGGGGAGTVGVNYTNGDIGGNGGAGIASSISGTVTVYAGGGAGGGAAAGGTGGAGGGGNGGYGGAGVSTGGTANTGSGGGGDWNGVSTAGSGGSGIVIISYPDTYSAPASFGGANSPTATTRGNGSLYFNGSSWIDYGATTSNYASGDFTIESWVNYSSFTAGYSLWFTMDPNTTYFGPTSSTRIVLNLGNGSELAWTYTAQTLGVWYHIAVVRSGSTITLYINGVSQGTNTSSATLGSGGGNIRVGNAVGYPFNGYLSNLRYTKSAVYTSAFTPSLYPLIPLTNTRLLTAVTSLGTYTDETGNSTSQTVTGSPTFNSSMPFQSGIGLQNRVYTWTASGTVTF